MGFVRQSGSGTARVAAACKTKKLRRFNSDITRNGQRNFRRLCSSERFRHERQRCHWNSDDGRCRDLVLRRPFCRDNFLLSARALRPWVYCDGEGHDADRVTAERDNLRPNHNVAARTHSQTDWSNNSDVKAPAFTAPNTAARASRIVD